MSESTAPRQAPTGIVVAIAVLLALPVVALMWVDSYARVEPVLFGFPFFYWYQFVWVFITAACTAGAYRLLMHVKGEKPADHGAGEGEII